MQRLGGQLRFGFELHPPAPEVRTASHSKEPGGGGIKAGGDVAAVQEGPSHHRTHLFGAIALPATPALSLNAAPRGSHSLWGVATQEAPLIYETSRKGFLSLHLFEILKTV